MLAQLPPEGGLCRVACGEAVLKVRVGGVAMRVVVAALRTEALRSGSTPQPITSWMPRCNPSSGGSTRARSAPSS